MTCLSPPESPGQIRLRGRLARLLSWLDRHLGVSVEYLEISGGADPAELALGGEGDSALRAASAAAEAVTDPTITVRLYLGGCARITVAGRAGSEAICATALVREADGPAVGALIQAVPGLRPGGGEVLITAAALRAACAAAGECVGIGA